MLGPLISAGATLLGGFFGQNAAQEQAERNATLQREFAQNTIQWRVADAKKAGVHPLYALGAPAISPSVSFGSQGMGPAIAAAGQDLGRAASAYMTPKETMSAATLAQSSQQNAANMLRLENMQLQNDLLRSRLAVINQPGTPPGVDFPVPEGKKPEERPPLMLRGGRWDTFPGTSPMKAWSDQYGDEGPMNYLMQGVIGADDAIHNWSGGRIQSLSALSYARAVQEFYRQAIQNFLNRGR